MAVFRRRIIRRDAQDVRRVPDAFSFMAFPSAMKNVEALPEDAGRRVLYVLVRKLDDVLLNCELLCHVVRHREDTSAP